MDTPSLKRSTVWCPSPRWSAPTTPRANAPASSPTPDHVFSSPLATVTKVTVETDSCDTLPRVTDPLLWPYWNWTLARGRGSRSGVEAVDSREGRLYGNKNTKLHRHEQS
ncbi:hypothetical protein CesoFtcFv8_025348 [Champsocephalus esox]|uniref:Uncharacterized protein n=1 Tax=Champsocephalus esox TaxID=159716 RepID=A0AAN8B3Q7_9TELE|nr:hypothetical protein CesoFtcFv8_025348 [Champsocephalus esox]